MNKNQWNEMSLSKSKWFIPILIITLIIDAITFYTMIWILLIPFFISFGLLNLIMLYHMGKDLKAVDRKYNK